jgi:hypothetical protein
LLGREKAKGHLTEGTKDCQRVIQSNRII